jgi:hypothetical protein
MESTKPTYLFQQQVAAIFKRSDDGAKFLLDGGFDARGLEFHLIENLTIQKVKREKEEKIGYERIRTPSQCDIANVSFSDCSSADLSRLAVMPCSSSTASTGPTMP